MPNKPPSMDKPQNSSIDKEIDKIIYEKLGVDKKSDPKLFLDIKTQFLKQLWEQGFWKDAAKGITKAPVFAKFTKGIAPLLAYHLKKLPLENPKLKTKPKITY